MCWSSLVLYHKSISSAAPANNGLAFDKLYKTKISRVCVTSRGVFKETAWDCLHCTDSLSTMTLVNY